MPNPIFRPATTADISEIVALINSCYRGDASRAGWTTEADLLDGMRTDDQEIRNLISAPDSMILVGESENEIIGSVHIEKRGDSSYLGLLVVKPGLQNGGIGRQVIDAAEDRARNVWGSRKMTMTVIPIRTELIAYYERRGYRRTGEVMPFPVDEWHIAKVDNLELEILEKKL